MQNKLKVITGEIIGDDVLLSIRELSVAYHVHAEFIIELVEYGLLEPQGDEPSTWQFDQEALRRLQIATRLQRDFDLDISGLGLVLDLLDEIQTLRNRVNVLERIS